MMRLGIICPLYFEASAFTPKKLPPQQPVQINEQVLLVISGTGRDRAKQAAQKLANENVNCLVSFGSAGALSPELKPGDLVLPKQVYDSDRTCAVNTSHSYLNLQCLSRHNITVHTGILACVDEVISSVEDKLHMFERTGAIAIDMETAGIVDTAEDNSLPVFVSRVIADPANLPIPDAILRHVDEFGDASIKGMAIELVKSPALLPTMLRLISSSRRAGKSMRMIAGELQGMS